MSYTGTLEERPLLDVVQIIAYSQQSGILSAEGGASKGLVIFERGNVVCAYSPSALSLLVKAAKEPDEKVRLSLRRIQVLTALRELFDLARGDYRFVRRVEPVPELEGLSIRSFYEAGPLDTGDLLLVLERAMEEPHLDLAPQTSEEVPTAPRDRSEQRRFPRFGPIIIKGKLIESGGGVIEGYLTNLSEGGTFLHAAELAPLGSTVELQFELPWNLGPCRTRAQVAWVRADGPEAKRGTGLSFVEFAGNSKVAIASYLARFQELASDVDFQA